MQQDYLAKRVEILEKTVEGAGGLSDRVDLLRADVNQLRADVNSLRTEFLQFKDETRREFAAIRAEMKEMRTDLIARIEAGDQETRSQMRLLHEEVIARFVLLHEGLNGRRKKSARAKKRRTH
jgi:hypothetical protein